MLRKIVRLIKSIRNLIVLALIILIGFTVFSYITIQKHSTSIYNLDDTNLVIDANDITIGIVFGGGVGEDLPLPLTKERLDTAKKLLDKGIVNKLILSGDNRFLNYNEPAVMYDYLVAQGIDKNALQQDFAGRSTYETCERANKIFGVNEAVLISESTHLPRAIYLCEHFGIKSIGVQSDGIIAASLRIPQQLREVIARDKAVFNVYLIGEKTLLGNKINLNIKQ